MATGEKAALAAGFIVVEQNPHMFFDELVTQPFMQGKETK